MSKPLLAFHGDPAIKESCILQIKEYIKSSQLQQEVYLWEYDKGSAVGCTIHSDEYSDYETKLGLPEDLAHIIDDIFNLLPIEEAKEFAVNSLKTIEAGATLSLVSSALILAILKDEEIGILDKLVHSPAETPRKMAINLYKRQLAGNQPTVEEWQQVYSLSNTVHDVVDRQSFYFTASAATQTAAYFYKVLNSTLPPGYSKPAPIPKDVIGFAVRAYVSSSHTHTYEKFYSILKDKLLELLANPPQLPETTQVA